MHRTLDKIIIGVMSFGYMAASVFLVVLSLGWTSPLLFVQNYLLYMTNRWVLGLSGAVLFLIAFTLFASSFRSRPEKQTVVHETSLGQVRITLMALDNLIVKASKSVQGIREVKTLLRSTGEGIYIWLRVQVLPDVNIPQMTEDLQKKVKEYLAKTAGVNVCEIKVTVNKIAWETKSRVE
ncbi:MAG: alkaline shock response membrane anchor protein AmaP [Peptococcaceae bacterium]|jgi:uncharacterized alkaline shock family protein YloU|nr:alkaline shock response membrane anchor protein AmaP [Peptococcaceae bacterium]MDH7525346.1 alkaline shock response membrane anchor protein AmaP [Peptococcaceae bacterium]